MKAFSEKGSDGLKGRLERLEAELIELGFNPNHFDWESYDQLDLAAKEQVLVIFSKWQNTKEIIAQVEGGK